MIKTLRSAALEIVRKAEVCRNVMLGDAQIDFNKLDCAEELVFQHMTEINNQALVENSLVGRIYREGVADGYAFYIVVDADFDVVFGHLPLGDAWESPMLERQRRHAPVEIIDYRLMPHAVYVSRRKPMTNEEFNTWEKELVENK